MRYIKESVNRKWKRKRERERERERKNSANYTSCFFAALWLCCLCCVEDPRLDRLNCAVCIHLLQLQQPQLRLGAEGAVLFWANTRSEYKSILTSNSNQRHIDTRRPTADTHRVFLTPLPLPACAAASMCATQSVCRIASQERERERRKEGRRNGQFEQEKRRPHMASLFFSQFMEVINHKQTL